MTLTLYAITDERPRKLSSVKIGNAWVVVAKGGKREPTPEALQAYDRVMRSIASSVSALLPFRFGSIARDEDDLEKLLAPFSASIGRALERTRDCVQFTLRVHGTAKQPKKPSAKRPGTRYLEARREALRVREIDPLTERTKKLVRDTRTERHDKGTHLATVYHLVPKKKVSAWRAAVEEGSALLEGVTLTTSGPWPPYAFAELP